MNDCEGCEHQSDCYLAGTTTAREVCNILKRAIAWTPPNEQKIRGVQ